MNFNYFMPTKVIIDKDVIKKNQELICSFGKKVLIVTGKYSSKENGSLKDILEILKNNEIIFEIFDAVMPNPTIQNIKQGLEISRDFKPDFIIGIGGGSSLDAAKAISVLSNNILDGEDIFRGEYKEKIIPNIAVPTTYGTGSEVTQYSIITDTKNNRKRNIMSIENFPKIALLDAKYTETLRMETSINTAIDALSHAIEGFLARRSSIMSDLIAKESIKILGEVLPCLKEDVTIKHREKLLYASMLAGIVIAQAGTTLVHAMGYQLTTFKKIDHGRANGIIMSKYLRFVYNEQKEKVNDILLLMNLNGIEEFENLMNYLLGEKEILTDKEINDFSKLAINEGNVKNTFPEPRLEEIVKMYRM